MVKIMVLKALDRFIGVASSTLDYILSAITCLAFDSEHSRPFFGTLTTIARAAFRLQAVFHLSSFPCASYIYKHLCQQSHELQLDTNILTIT
jgi:hypothetical protein